MVIVMAAHASTEAVTQVRERVASLGFDPHVIEGVERTIVAVVGDERPVAPDVFATLEGVERVVSILHPYKLASRDFHPADGRIVLANGASLGGGTLTVMAGPCAVESEAQLRATAEAVAAAGVRILRGGAYKPRTSPYSFQGLGLAGLRTLRQVADELDMAIVTEVVAPEDVAAVAEDADVLQIGARNMANYALLRAVGAARRPVLLKRGLGSTVDELLQAAEYVLAQGNPQVALCERGIRTFEHSTRFTLDIGAVPVLKKLTWLPVVVDPSHAAGSRDLVPALARAGVAAGADGLLIEVHADPRRAMSDGPQSLDPAMFAALMRDLARIADALGPVVAA
ncbi:MAG TPA: 3-deoxy-7-phosphoheptulonate synthase [Candidatus Limnocylindria bacterium]|nr:3-deoxy-7-phosphoheptulonate synthase [Candidatus Limnocylindria bacterium]